MDDRHPKRRKDKYNPYTLSMIDGKCYLSFRDGQGVPHRLELDVKLYAVFDRFELDDLSFLNEQERHLDWTGAERRAAEPSFGTGARPRWRTPSMNPCRRRRSGRASTSCRKSRKKAADVFL